MTDPNNPYMMDPAKMQRQQARTDRQNQRTATQQMGQQVQTAMGQLPAQPVPQVASDAMQGYEQMNQTAQAMPQAVQQANLMQTHFPGGPPPPQQGVTGGGFAAGRPMPPMGGQIAGAPAQISQPAGQPGGFNPRKMIQGYAGAQRGAAMEKMARPSGVRRGMAQAKATGALPGTGGPPKPPTY